MRWSTLLAVAAFSASSGCNLPVPPPAQAPVAAANDYPETPEDALPASSPTYATDPTEGALLGGPLAFAAERQVVGMLAGRGDHALGDGRLAQLARWGGRRAARGILLEPPDVDAVARRLGYVGPTPWIVFFPRGPDPEHPVADADLEKTLAAVPSNVPVTRYGIATITRGGQEAVAIALNSLEVTLAPVPKRFAVNDKLHLTGKVGDRFATSRLAITLPGGQVKTWDSASREMAGTWALSESGPHRIEILGDGASGPVVVANFPIYVGVDEPDPALGQARVADRVDGAAPPDAGAVEATMLALLNDARAEAHLRPVAPDEALAAVARAHSADMAAHGFFGHVSPTTGTTQDRLRAAHLLYSEIGENVARSDSAEHAHDSLMTSPAHRGAMLGADFTHVGIGAVVRAEASRADVYVTLELAREAGVALPDVPRKVLEATDMARMPTLIPRLTLDPALTQAAEAGVAVLASDPTATTRALEAARSAAVRARPPTSTTCVVLGSVPDVTRMVAPVPARDPRAARLGVAAVHDPQAPDAFLVLYVIQGAPGRGLACQ